MWHPFCVEIRYHVQLPPCSTTALVPHCTMIDRLPPYQTFVIQTKTVFSQLSQLASPSKPRPSLLFCSLFLRLHSTSHTSHTTLLRPPSALRHHPPWFKSISTISPVLWSNSRPQLSITKLPKHRSAIMSTATPQRTTPQRNATSKPKRVNLPVDSTESAHLATADVAGCFVVYWRWP